MFKEWRRKNTLKKKHSKSRNSRTFPCSTASCAASTDPKASIPLATKVSVKRLAAVAGQAVQKRLRMAHKTPKTIGIWGAILTPALRIEPQWAGRAGQTVIRWFLLQFQSHGLVGNQNLLQSTYFVFSSLPQRHAKLGTHITMTPPTVSSPVPPELLKRIRLKGTAKLVTPAGT